MTFKAKKETGRFKTDSANQPSPDDQHPVFCFRYMDRNGKYCIGACEKDEKVALLNKLEMLSQAPWKQWKQTNYKAGGYTEIDRSAIRAGIPAFVTEDVTKFGRVRFKDKAPMVGYKVGAVFHVLWLDRDMTLYDHGA